MTAVNGSTNLGMPSLTASAVAETDALIQSASRGGSLDTHLLAQEVAKLSPDQQNAVTSELRHQLSPVQEGQFERAAQTISQARADADLPASYVRGADGKLQLAPDYEKQACVNYNKMMVSNTKVGDVFNFGFGGATTLSLGSHALDAALGSVVGKTVGWITAVGSLTTGALAHAPPPPGCEKK